MTVVPRICNHALTVYKAVFTPINSAHDNSTSRASRPQHQLSEGETGIQRGNGTCPSTLSPLHCVLLQRERDFDDLTCLCRFLSHLIDKRELGIAYMPGMGRRQECN